jgi:large subunit ribosomal protein L32
LLHRGRCPSGLAAAATGNDSEPTAGVDRSQENFMAVQQNKKSPSKRGMHRSHNALVTPGTAIESTTGEVHLRHHISPTGFYRGRKVLKTKADA